MTNKQYLCVGENFRDDIKIGFCGDVHSLKSWIELLFPNNAEQALDFFKNDRNSEVLDYLYKFKGKRLKEVK